MSGAGKLNKKTVILLLLALGAAFALGKKKEEDEGLTLAGPRTKDPCPPCPPCGDVRDTLK